MIRLRLLGGLGLAGPDDQNIRAVLQQPKRLALLAYLALADPGTFRRRGTVLLLFWPDADEEHARSALNQATHFLRELLHAGIVTTRGPGELGVDTGILWCDVTAFERALSSGDRVEALRLYRGDLLPGFSVRAGAEFDQWLDDTRNRLRRRAASAAWGLADGAEQRQQYGAAAGWARRAVEISPDDAAAVQRLLRLLGRVGDFAGALAAYDRFATRLAREREVKPSAATRQLIASIRSGADCTDHGSLLRPEELDGPPADASTTPGVGDRVPGDPGTGVTTWHSVGASVSQAGAGNGRWRTPFRSAPGIFQRESNPWVWAGVVLAAALGIVLGHGGSPPVRPSEPDYIARVIVQEFADRGAVARSPSFGTALTASVVSQLAHVRSLAVLTLPPHGRSLPSNASGLSGPRLLLTGGVLRAGERVRVDVELIDATNGRVVKTAVFERALRDQFALTDSLSQEIASMVRAAAGREAELRGWRARAGSERAYELMRQAREDRDRGAELERAGNLATASRALWNADSTLGMVAHLAPGWSEPWVERAEVSRALAALSLAPPLRDSHRVEGPTPQGSPGGSARRISQSG